MKKNLFFIILLFLFLKPAERVYSQCISYDVHACIDFMDDLHFKDNQLWWVHFGGSNPGQHSSCSGDVLSVNGTSWGNWSTPFTISGNLSCMDMTSNVTQCSNACYLQQAPSSANGWETIYRFDDSGPSAAHPYKIVFTFCPATHTSMFTVSAPACAGNDITVTYTGTGADDASYNWNFDGATIVSGSGKGPYVINWAAPGNYNITLDVTDCSSTSPVTTVPVTVAISPTSYFEATANVCKDSAATIVYTGSGSTGATYNWDFDGGTVVSGSGQGPYEVSWPAAATKNITLQVDESGCLSPVTTKPVTIIEPPTSIFSASPPVCRGDAVTITYAGTASLTADYFWNFSTGIILSGSGQGPYNVSWPVAGTYDIRLTVVENGCPSPETIVQQTIDPPPNAQFSAPDVCLEQPTAFTDLSNFSGGTISSWQWNDENGIAFSYTQSPTYTYNTSGTHAVTLIVTNNLGCADTVSQDVVVHDLPVANYVTHNVCDGFFAQFSNQSTITAPDAIQLSMWDFGDGSSLNNQNASHLYADDGTYNVKLTTISSFGCIDSITKAIVVNPNPVIDFTASDTANCQPLCTSFLGTSSGATSQWTWNLGDNAIINNSQSFNHCFTNDSVFTAVNYSPQLTVTSDSGCTSSLTKTNYISVYPNPVANFTVEPETSLYTDATITLFNLSTGATKWNWNFGDLQTDSTASPEPHKYADTGAFIITLITTNSYSCSDTTYRNITIEPDFVFYIPNAFSPDEDGINETFSGKGLFITAYEMRIFDRWGNMIFFSDSMDKPWDGKANGGKDWAQRDVYVYSIELTDVKSRKHLYKGTVSLIR